MKCGTEKCQMATLRAPLDNTDSSQQLEGKTQRRNKFHCNNVTQPLLSNTPPFPGWSLELLRRGGGGGGGGGTSSTLHRQCLSSQL